VANKHGWSAFSAKLPALTAALPDAMLTPTVSYATSGTAIAFVWVEPGTGGAPITAYELLIEEAGAGFSVQAGYCDGSTAGVLAARKCEVPLTTLRAAPYSLALDADVRAKVRASNTVGPGPYSPVSATGVKV
jgi:hypothetical protein